MNSYKISWSWIHMWHFMTYEFIYEFMYMKNIVKSYLNSCVPRFQMEQISNLKLRIKLSTTYHDQTNIIEKAITNICWFWFMKHFCQSWPVLGIYILQLEPKKVGKLRRGLSFSGLSFPFHKHYLENVCSFMWAMTRNFFGLSKLRSDMSFVDFSLKYK